MEIVACPAKRDKNEYQAEKCVYHPADKGLSEDISR
tara:strand:+ start:553 stop:660 length:108 start_codon:yes stop_codon:yes gene_type:complete